MNGDNQHPPIFLPPGDNTEKRRRGGGGSGPETPDRGRQTARLDPKFTALKAALGNSRLAISPDMDDQDPELVLVFEVATSVDRFLKAAAKIDGFEVLVDLGDYEADPDADFHHEDVEKSLNETLYLVATNRRALDEVLRLWAIWKAEEKFPRGYTPFRDLFTNLRDVRRWDVGDRLDETGLLEDLRQRLGANAAAVPFEIELWFRSSETDRRKAAGRLEEMVVRASGQVVATSQIPDIRYHAALVRVPADVARDLLNSASDMGIAQMSEIMFMRPVGQAAPPVFTDDETLGAPAISGDTPTNPEPLIALLDGLPVENHDLLDGRLEVDDPDGVAGLSQVSERRHGTAMASVIIHGDLTDPDPALDRPLHVRPIMAPAGSARVERLPEGQLTVDLLYRAVRRLFEGEGGVPPTAPTVRVINLSIGDPMQMFHHRLSPWARLVDWLAAKYGILIVVSAGNHFNDLVLDVQLGQLPGMSPDDLEDATLRAMHRDQRLRRVIAPAEAINALTVGAVAADASVPAAQDRRLDPVTSGYLPAPYSRIGRGFRRAVKPEILMPGGRLRYEPLQTGSSDPAVLTLSGSGRPPGVLCAAPRTAAANRSNGTLHQAGTSIAAARASRVAGDLWQLVDDLRAGSPPPWLDDDVMPALVKSLVVHGASWGDGYAAVARALARPRTDHQREVAGLLLGYGLLEVRRLTEGSPDRITLLAGGKLSHDQGRIHRIPLPPALNAVIGRRRLTYTLAWMSPTTSTDQRYRRARLWAVPQADQLNVKRDEVDHHAVQRGTVQHEVMTGIRAATIADGDEISVHVSCASDAGDLDAPIAYGLALTMEVATPLATSLYEDVATRVQPRIPVPAARV